jgi:hypothetical protein
MQIEIRRGITLRPGTYNAVVAPEKEIVAAINTNADLQRILFLSIGGNYPRNLSGPTGPRFQFPHPVNCLKTLVKSPD